MCKEITSNTFDIVAYVEKYQKAKSDKPKKARKRKPIGRNYIQIGGKAEDGEDEERHYTMTLHLTVETAQEMIARFGEYVFPFPRFETGDIHFTTKPIPKIRRKISIKMSKNQKPQYSISMDTYAKDFVNQRGYYDRFYLSNPIYNENGCVFKFTGDYYTKPNKQDGAE